MKSMCVERVIDQIRYSEQIRCYCIEEKYLAYSACVSSDICRYPDKVKTWETPAAWANVFSCVLERKSEKERHV